MDKIFNKKNVQFTLWMPSVLLKYLLKIPKNYAEKFTKSLTDFSDCVNYTNALNGTKQHDNR